MPRSPEVVIAVVGDMHIGAKENDKNPQFYLSSDEIISSMIDIKEVYGDKVRWVLNGDLAHQGNTEFAYELADVVKAAGILYDTKLAINGNHEWKKGLKNNKELWRIYQGESNITMVEGVVYNISEGEDTLGIVGFNGYFECGATWEDGIAAATEKYHAASLRDLPQFVDLLNQMTAKNNMVASHAPFPWGSLVNKMFLHEQFGEEIMKRRDRISHIAYGHIHDSPKDDPQPTVIYENGITMVNAAVPFRKATGQDLITIIDFSKVPA